MNVQELGKGCNCDVIVPCGQTGSPSVRVQGSVVSVTDPADHKKCFEGAQWPPMGKAALAPEQGPLWHPKFSASPLPSVLRGVCIPHVGIIVLVAHSARAGPPLLGVASAV